jgi:hypothetical protein
MTTTVQYVPGRRSSNYGGTEGVPKLRVDFNFKPYFNYLSSIFSALSGQQFLWFGFLEARKMKIFRAVVSCIVDFGVRIGLDHWNIIHKSCKHIVQRQCGLLRPHASSNCMLNKKAYLQYFPLLSKQCAG